MAAVKTAQRAPRLSRKAQGEQTRRAILHAAVELYAETGVRGTGLIAIGERAGVHHATVLYHYRSSRELLLAVLDERDRQFTDFSREAFKEGGLRALQNLPIAARFNVEHPVWTKLFAVLQAENLDAGAEAPPYSLARRNNLRRRLIARLREAKRRGEIRAEVDETATADVIQAFMSGAQTQHLLDPKHTDLIPIYQH